MIDFTVTKIVLIIIAFLFFCQLTGNRIRENRAAEGKCFDRIEIIEETYQEKNE